MASYNKFQDFVEQLCKGVHNLDAAGDTVNVYLSDEAPLATDTVKADIAEISTGNGYSGPVDTQQTLAEAGGTATLTGSKVTITASGGAIAQFRYIVLYNDTPTSPTDPLISWWDYGSELNLGDGESLTIKFNGGDPTGTIFTLS